MFSPKKKNIRKIFKKSVAESFTRHALFQEVSVDEIYLGIKDSNVFFAFGLEN